MNINPDSLFDALFIDGPDVIDTDGDLLSLNPILNNITGMSWDHLPKFLPEDETSLEECITVAFARAKLEAIQVIKNYEDFEWEKLHQEDAKSYCENKDFFEKYQTRLANITKAEKIRVQLDIFGKLRLLNYLSLCADEEIFDYRSFNWTETKNSNQDEYKSHYIFIYQYISRAQKINIKIRSGEYIKTLDTHITNIRDMMGKKFISFDHATRQENSLTTPSVTPSARHEDIKELQHNLNSMIGLTTVKLRVSALVSEIAIRKEREAHRLPISDRSYHMVFTGNAGTGKTVVARIIAKLFYALGLTKKDTFVEATRGDLVGGYIGHTAIQTNQVIDKSLGGVLFIDEAYTLKGEGNDFGSEAITTLLKRMEDERDNLVVIIAGYEMEMDELLDTNQGLHSRFSRKIHFDDYDEHELTEILKLNFEKNHYRLDTNISNDFLNMIIGIHSQDKAKFSNGRGVRNLFERIIENQEIRLHKNSWMGKLDREDLQLVKLEDIVKTSEPDTISH